MKTTTNKNDVKATVIVDKSKEIKSIGIIHYIAMFVWVGWFLFVPMLHGLLVVLFFYNKMAFSILLGLFMLTIFYPITPEAQPEWGWKLGHWMITNATEYLGVKIIMVNQSAIEKSGPAFFILEPHDVLPFTICCFLESLGYFKGHHARGCVTSVCFQIPFMRHFYTWCRSSNVEKKNLQHLIKSGNSPVICPGGAQEVTHLKHDKEVVLFLKNRFGLVRLAMEFGVPLIPTFTFGLRKTFKFWIPKNEFLHSIGRKVGFIPLLFVGAFNIPFGIPYSVPLTLVVGEPIPMPKLSNPTQEQLEEAVNKMVKAYEALFEQYKVENGMKDSTLRII